MKYSGFITIVLGLASIFFIFRELKMYFEFRKMEKQEDSEGFKSILSQHISDYKRIHVWILLWFWGYFLASLIGMVLAYFSK